MNKSKQKITGIKDLDTPQMESMRAAVVEQELSARSWKAYYEKMYYSLESEKIEPLYAEYKVRAEEKLKLEKEQFEAFKKALAQEVEKQNQADTQGAVSIEGLTADNPITSKDPEVQLGGTMLVDTTINSI